MALTPFERYFDLHFQTSLANVGDEVVFSSGLTIGKASWDRKAAYLLWCEIGRPGEDAKAETPVDTDEWDII